MVLIPKKCVALTEAAKPCQNFGTADGVISWESMRAFNFLGLRAPLVVPNQQQRNR